MNSGRNRVRSLFVKPLSPAVKQAAAGFIRDERGAVFLTYALSMLTMLIALGIGLDFSNALQTKYRLDLAADSASVACSETWQNIVEQGAAAATTTALFSTLESNANTAAQAAGQNAFLAQAGQLGPLVSANFPKVTTTDGATLTPGGAAVTYQAANPDFIMQIVGFTDVTLIGDSTSTVNLAPFTQVFLILDTSASMMVGSTPTDQGLIANFVQTHDSKLPANSPNLILASGSGDTSPCAFACHEQPKGTAFNVSDMQAGETNAHLALATTRFDVMRLALVNDPVTQSFCTTATGTTKVTCGPAGSQEGLLSYIRDTYQATNARANLNTFAFNMYGFNSGINGNEPPASVLNPDVTDFSQTVVANTNELSAVATGINQLTIGLDTHLMPPMPIASFQKYSKTQNSVLQDLVTIVGTANNTCTPGACSNNPLKFVIIITDGMSSDRNWNWCDPTQAASCDNDTTPPGSPMLTTSIATNCANWLGAAPVFDGVSVYTGGTGQCNNPAYRPGFWTATGDVADSNPVMNKSKTGTTSVRYASPIDTDATTTNSGGKSFCSQMKANGGAGNGNIPGVTIAVLETPYVPLTGQDPSLPATPNYPYENGVQQAIYPAGNPVSFPSSYPPGPHGENMSALSAALLACATGPDFYFQASTDTQITTGFIQLFNTFVGEYVHLTQ
jgi:Flp pilus assembly protein TadG